MSFADPLNPETPLLPVIRRTTPSEFRSHQVNRTLGIFDSLRVKVEQTTPVALEFSDTVAAGEPRFGRRSRRALEFRSQPLLFGHGKKQLLGGAGGDLV